MGIFSVLGILATPLGYVMRFMYSIVNNYGIALILFTLVTRLVLFPLQIIQQKSTAKNAAYQPFIQDIQKKWANDKDRQQREMMKFQEENNIKMSAGCLPMLVNMLILFSVIEVVYRPLRYILGIDATLITSATEYLKTLAEYSSATDYTAQSYIIGLVHAGDAGMIEILGSQVVAQIQSFNFNFLGLNLAQVPTFSDLTTVILPVISIITMLGSQLIVMRTSGQQAGAGKSMVVMTLVMAVWMGYYSFIVPVAFSLYYSISNVLSFLQQLIVKRIYDPEKYKQKILEEFEERKKAKKAKKSVQIREENGEVITKELSDSELARLRLARARELDEKRYADEEEQKKNAEAIEMARKKDEEKYVAKSIKNDSNKLENLDNKTEEIAQVETLQENETEDIQAQAENSSPEAAEKPAYKPGRRKRASEKKLAENTPAETE